MTDRHSGYLVTLAEDIREDDAEAIFTAIRVVKGVISVDPIVANHDLRVAQRRESMAWQQMLLRVMRLADDVGPDSVAPESKS